MENIEFYLGDGVYVQLMYGEILLTTFTEGGTHKNTIYLDYGMLEELIRRVKEYSKVGELNQK